jgi:DNA-binding Xre family transcriptional regulator
MLCEDTLDDDLATPIRLWLCTNLECSADEIVEYLDNPKEVPVPGQLAFIG